MFVWIVTPAHSTQVKITQTHLLQLPRAPASCRRRLISQAKSHHLVYCLFTVCLFAGCVRTSQPGSSLHLVCFTLVPKSQATAHFLPRRSAPNRPISARCSHLTMTAPTPPPRTGFIYLSWAWGDSSEETGNGKKLLSPLTVKVTFTLRPDLHRSHKQIRLQIHATSRWRPFWGATSCKHSFNFHISINVNNVFVSSHWSKTCN